MHIQEENRSVLKLVLPWILLFLVLNISYYEDGDVNALSRYAAMRAMSMDYTFQIDHYIDWSMDWSKAANGHYYSNKAPGPMLIGYPLFWLIDHAKLLFESDFGETYRQKHTLGYEHKVIVPLLLQMIPLCLLVILVAKYLVSIQASSIAITFTTIALLFGNTASLLMTTWFGHGFAACLILALFLAMMHQKWKLSGLLLGLAILSDYSVTLFLPAVMGYLAYTKQFRKEVITGVLVGGILPGILWIWYHWNNFGSPFALPNMYQNPKFGGDSLGQQFHFAPIPYYMLVLVFGNQRGILFTQPWVLALIAVTLWYLYNKRLDRQQQVLFGGVVLTFFLLLVMNAAFTGWHGGSTPGPRYLSGILPLFAVVGGMVYDRTSPLIRHSLWMGLIVSVIFAGLVYGTTILAYEHFTIWTWLLDFLEEGKGSATRIGLYFISLILVTIYVFKYQLKATTEDIYT